MSEPHQTHVRLLSGEPWQLLGVGGPSLCVAEADGRVYVANGQRRSRPREPILHVLELRTLNKDAVARAPLVNCAADAHANLAATGGADAAALALAELTLAEE